MQANNKVAKELAELTVRARQQRKALQDEIHYLRNKPRGIKEVGVSAVKAASSLGIGDSKILLGLTKTILLPTALALGKVVLKNGSPKRFLGAALIAASTLGIFKGIEYDHEHKNDKKPPRCEIN